VRVVVVAINHATILFIREVNMRKSKKIIWNNDEFF